MIEGNKPTMIIIDDPYADHCPFPEGSNLERIFRKMDNQILHSKFRTWLTVKLPHSGHEAVLASVGETWGSLDDKPVKSVTVVERKPAWNDLKKWDQFVQGEIKRSFAVPPYLLGITNEIMRKRNQRSKFILDSSYRTK